MIHSQIELIQFLSSAQLSGFVSTLIITWKIMHELYELVICFYGDFMFEFESPFIVIACKRAIT